MKKIMLIIQREYLTRVKKRSFIIMTILGPVLMAAIVIVPIYIATRTNEKQHVAVLDESGLFQGKFKDTDDIKFRYLTGQLSAAKSGFREGGDHVLLYIPPADVSLPSNAILYAENNVNINVKSYIRNTMTREIEDLKLGAKLKDIQSDSQNPLTVDDIMRSVKTTIDLNTIKLGDDGTEKKSYTEISMVLGLFAGILIYFFIFMFGSQVMRGVIEEKTSRIVEVIVSSVKPFQLMIGKVIGVGMVGLTQFLLWVVLTFAIVTTATSVFAPEVKQAGIAEKMIRSQQPLPVAPDAGVNTINDKNGDANPAAEIFEALNSIDFPVMIGAFIFFFLFGYLLYAALFAAIGGAVDSEADTQQFMLPITVPLILAMVLSQFIIQDPGGPVAFWLSMIPFTSPVIMMIRIPFGVPYWEVALSMSLLVLGFLGTTWLAGRIYRTGILMYGKKVNYKELWKWIRY